MISTCPEKPYRASPDVPVDRLIGRRVVLNASAPPAFRSYWRVIRRVNKIGQPLRYELVRAEDSRGKSGAFASNTVEASIWEFEVLA